MAVVRLLANPIEINIYHNQWSKNVHYMATNLREAVEEQKGQKQGCQQICSMLRRVSIAGAFLLASAIATKAQELVSVSASMESNFVSSSGVTFVGGISGGAKLGLNPGRYFTISARGNYDIGNRFGGGFWKEQDLGAAAHGTIDLNSRGVINGEASIQIWQFVQNKAFNSNTYVLGSELNYGLGKFEAKLDFFHAIWDNARDGRLYSRFLRNDKSAANLHISKEISLLRQMGNGGPTMVPNIGIGYSSNLFGKGYNGVYFNFGGDMIANLGGTEFRIKLNEQLTPYRLGKRAGFLNLGLEIKR